LAVVADKSFVLFGKFIFLRCERKSGCPSIEALRVPNPYFTFSCHLWALFLACIDMRARFWLTFGFLAAIDVTGAEVCAGYRSTIAYGLDPAAINVPLGSVKPNQPLPKGSKPDAKAERLPVELVLRSFDFSLQSFSSQHDGSIRLQGIDVKGNPVIAIAPPGFCAAMSPWARHIAAVHHALASHLNPELVGRVQRGAIVITGVPFVQESGELVIQPILQVQLPESAPPAAVYVRDSQPAVSRSVQTNEVRAPFRAQSDNSSPVGVRALAPETGSTSTAGFRYGLADSSPRSSTPVMESGTLFFLILAVMGIFIVVSLAALGSALSQSTRWKVEDLAADEGQKASLARTLALLGAPILLGGYLGLTIAGIAAVLEGRFFPDTSSYLLAGGTLFLPYIVNQGRMAIQRGFTAAPVRVTDVKKEKDDEN
jgi:hypothetical protein